jgi:broad specificity phosphatase PhoE
MRTTLFLLRHAATAANLEQPPRLQGRRHNPPLAPLGVRQAELTRDFLAVRAIDVCYSSPLARAMETATIVAGPHGLAPQPIEELIEIDVGAWEGRSWAEVRAREPGAYRAFMADPVRFGYPGGENFEHLHRRSSRAIEELLRRHEGKSVLVVSHHAVNRVYLSGLLGLPPERARQVSLDNCGISLVLREEGHTSVTMLNAAFHLQGAAA